MKKRFFLFLIVFSVISISYAAEDGFTSVQSQVVEQTLKNGLKIIILPRHDAPVVSFHTYVDVGSVNEDRGITGLAHIFEHLAFKGTSTIGTKDYKKEKISLEKLDHAWETLRTEERKGDKADSTKLIQLRSAFEQTQAEASSYVVNNEYGQITEENGGVGLNANTSWEATQYIISYPSNKLELWMSLESSRFLDPVFRDFYKEKNVVMEERRMRTESSPVGKLIEDFLSVAYKAHPYRDPVIGYTSDLESITRTDAINFYKKNYVPSNIVVGIVGDVDPAEVIRLAEIYFGRISAGPKPEALRTIEPPQHAEKRVLLHEHSQPFFVMGYKKGSMLDPDDAVQDAITDLMSSGRTSRLYRSLVRDKKIAIDAGGFSGFPGQKFPNMFVFYAVPAQGKTNAECQSAIEAEITKLKNEPVDDETLKAVKTRAKAELIRSLASNSGFAGALTFWQVMTNDWHNMFKQLDNINAVTAADIQRVAKQIFTDDNRTIGTIEPVSEEKEK